MKKEKMANDKKDDSSNFKLQIKHLKEMIERTILAHHQYKVMDILSSNDVNLSIQYLEKIYRNLESIEKSIIVYLDEDEDEDDEKDINMQYFTNKT